MGRKIKKKQRQCRDELHLLPRCQGEESLKSVEHLVVYKAALLFY